MIDGFQSITLKVDESGFSLLVGNRMTLPLGAGGDARRAPQSIFLRLSM